MHPHLSPQPPAPSLCWELHKGVRIRWLDKNGRVRKKNQLNAGITARVQYALKTDELQRDHETRVNVNAAKAERIVSMPYAEKKLLMRVGGATGW